MPHLIGYDQPTGFKGACSSSSRFFQSCQHQPLQILIMRVFMLIRAEPPAYKATYTNVLATVSASIDWLHESRIQHLRLTVASCFGPAFGLMPGFHRFYGVSQKSIEPDAS